MIMFMIVCTCTYVYCLLGSFMGVQSLLRLELQSESQSSEGQAHFFCYLFVRFVATLRLSALCAHFKKVLLYS